MVAGLVFANTILPIPGKNPEVPISTTQLLAEDEPAVHERSTVFPVIVPTLSADGGAQEGAEQLLLNIPNSMPEVRVEPELCVKTVFPNGSLITNPTSGDHPPRLDTNTSVLRPPQSDIGTGP